VILAQHFLESFRESSPHPPVGLERDAIAAVARHAWPGNVRELQNRVKRAVVLAEGPRISAADLDLSASAAEDGNEDPPTLREAIREVEVRAVVHAWTEAAGNVSKASRLLGVSRPTLYKLLKEHGLK